VAALISKPGLSGAAALSIPKDWDPAWFRGFINNLLKGADVRNAIGANGIKVSGNISSPYATISFGPGPIVLTGTGTSIANAPLTILATGAGGPFAEVFSDGTNTGSFIGFGSSPNHQLQIGTTQNFDLQLIAGGLVQLQVGGTTSGVTIGTPTGSFQGAGTLNLSGGLFFNGVSQIQSGTFTVTLVGCTTAPTATAHYAIAGNVCVVEIANASNLNAVSNTTGCSVTGLPAVCQPATQFPGCMCFFTDNSLAVLASAEMQPGSGTITFFRGVVTGTAVVWSASGFTAALQKGPNSTVLAYTLQ
jgi:hypothetical protein